MPLLFGRPWLCSSNKSTSSVSTSTNSSKSSKSSKRSQKQRKRHQQALKQFLYQTSPLPALTLEVEDHSDTCAMDQSDSTTSRYSDRQVRFHPSVDKEMERRRKYRMTHPPKIDPKRVQTRTRQQLDLPTMPTPTLAPPQEQPSQSQQQWLQHQDSLSILEKAPAWGWGYVEEDDEDDNTECTAESSYASFFDDFVNSLPPVHVAPQEVYHLSENRAEF